MDLEKIFNDEYNAYSEIQHLVGGKIVKESMPCMNKEKFIEVVEKLLIHDVVKSLPTEEELGEEIKNKLAEINKDKPVPSTKQDLGYSNGFIDCYEFMTK